MQDAAARVVTANGGKVLGALRVPLSTAGFRLRIFLQAQNLGARVLGHSPMLTSLFLQLAGRRPTS